jgi:hypothetical protein
LVALNVAPPLAVIAEKIHQSQDAVPEAMLKIGRVPTLSSLRTIGAARVPLQVGAFVTVSVNPVATVRFVPAANVNVAIVPPVDVTSHLPAAN